MFAEEEEVRHAHNVVGIIGVAACIEELEQTDLNTRLREGGREEGGIQ